MFKSVFRELNPIRLIKSLFSKNVHSERADTFIKGQKPSHKKHTHDIFYLRNDIVQKAKKVSEDFSDVSLKNHKHNEYIANSEVENIESLRIIPLESLSYLNQIPAYAFSPKNHKHPSYKEKQNYKGRIKADKGSFIYGKNGPVTVNGIYSSLNHEHSGYVSKKDRCIYTQKLGNQKAEHFDLKNHFHEQYHDVYKSVKPKFTGLEYADYINLNQNQTSSFAIILGGRNYNTYTKNVTIHPRSVIPRSVVTQKVGISNFLPTVSSAPSVSMKFTAGTTANLVTLYKSFFKEGVFYPTYSYGQGATRSMKYALVFYDSDVYSNLKKVIKRRLIVENLPTINVSVDFKGDLIDSSNKTADLNNSSFVKYAGIYNDSDTWIPSINPDDNSFQSIGLSIKAWSMKLGTLLKHSFNLAVLTILNILTSIANGFYTVGDNIDVEINIFGWKIRPFSFVASVFYGIANAIGAGINAIISTLLMTIDTTIMYVGANPNNVIIYKYHRQSDGVPIDEFTGELKGETIVTQSINRVVGSVKIDTKYQFYGDPPITYNGVFGGEFSNINEIKNYINDLINVQYHFAYYSIKPPSSSTSSYYVTTKYINGFPVYLMRGILPIRSKQIGFNLSVAQDQIIVYNTGIPFALFTGLQSKSAGGGGDYMAP